MMGVNIHSIQKFRRELLDNGWTLVIVKEKDTNSTLPSDSRKLREIKEIVSGATSDAITGKTYNLASIYAEPIKGVSGKVESYSVGFASVNTQTG